MQESDQLYSKLDKMMQLVAASGSQRSAVSSTTSFYDKLERQLELSTPPPSLNSIPLNFTYHGRQAESHQDTGSQPESQATINIEKEKEKKQGKD